MARIGVLSISDGRDFVARDLVEHITHATTALAEALRKEGHEVIVAPEIVWTNELATSQARWLADRRPDLTILRQLQPLELRSAAAAVAHIVFAATFFLVHHLCEAAVERGGAATGPGPFPQREDLVLHRH